MRTLLFTACKYYIKASIYMSKAHSRFGLYSKVLHYVNTFVADYFVETFKKVIYYILFMIEKTLVLLKPDAVQRGLIGEIISRFERVGLKIIGLKLVYADEKIAGMHYANDEEWLLAVGNKALSSAKEKGFVEDRSAKQIGESVREMLISYLAMSPIIAMALEGHGAVKMVRKIVGETNPQKSLPGTIRGDYTTDSYELADFCKRPIQNLIHASESVSEATRELALWFKEEELHVWKRIDEELLYRKG